MGFELDPAYKDVPQRMADFKAQHPDGCLRPVDEKEPYRIECIDGRYFIVYCAAAYRSPDDTLPGIGLAWEPFPGKTSFTKDSELQNAETSAWGRAIVASLRSESKSVASAEDIRNRRADAEAPHTESDEVTVKLVTTVAGRVFKAAGEEAPEGTKTLVRDRLRHAVIWAATKGRTSSLKDCTQDDLAAVYGRLKLIETGTVTFTYDHAGVVFSAPQGAKAVLWNEFENTTKKGAGVDGPVGDGDAGDVGRASAPQGVETGDGSGRHEVGRPVPEPVPAQQMGEGEGPSGSSPEPIQGALTAFENEAEAIADAAPEVTR